jgi:hypothetical protein
LQANNRRIKNHYKKYKESSIKQTPKTISLKTAKANENPTSCTVLHYFELASSDVPVASLIHLRADA